ncbi:tail assembly chaperone [Mycobacterium phage KayaCho]|uniref:tail assembly chaperone n=1 Tax=Mycobacterium phage KayaCho TaxID=1340830 RepID=UPI0003881B5F|nr:tail assembly chaperone [Mycobacterium phage KayaCho]AGT12925.1 tail assembly chaperone [Mycobacterium phage KayaCho]
MTARIRARVEIDEAALERESGRDLRAFHRSLTRRIANQARADVPVRTGNLGRTIGEMPQVYTPFHVSGGVEATADYAAAVHEGSRPHRIAARSADALRFVWHGRVMFRKSVWHPGTRARPFLRNAARRVVGADPRVH